MLYQYCACHTVALYSIHTNMPILIARLVTIKFGEECHKENDL